MPKFQLDEPSINAVGWLEEPGYHWIRVGVDGVTKVTHREQFCGDNSIQWLEVWKGEQLTARYNAANVDCIAYDEETGL